MKVHIHPHYAAYESYIRAIPSEEYEREEVYCNRRNTVERVRFRRQGLRNQEIQKACPHKLPHLHLVSQKQSAARL